MTDRRYAWLALALVGAACSGEPGEVSLGPKCAEGLAIAERELDTARAQGFGESVAFGKAASLIGAARRQQGFGEYELRAQDPRRAGVSAPGRGLTPVRMAGRRRLPGAASRRSVPGTGLSTGSRRPDRA